MKKYIILKKTRPVQKAAGGLGSDPTMQLMQTMGQQSMFPGVNSISTPGMAPMSVAAPTGSPPPLFSKAETALRGFGSSAGNALKDMGANLKENFSSGAGIAAGASLVSGFGDMIGQKAIEKNKKEFTDGFGLVDPDEKAITKSGALSGAMKGLSTGASAGAMLGPWGAAAGAFVGLIGGLFAGKKKAKREAAERQKAYEKSYATAHAGALKNADIAAAQALANIPTTSLRNIQPQKQLYKRGGKLETPGAVNIITKGKLHKENNNLGNKDKGIPVVSADGTKEYELEKEELVLRRDATLAVEDLVKKFDNTNDITMLEALGKFVAGELLSNTQDNSDKYKMTVA